MDLPASTCAKRFGVRWLDNALYGGGLTPLIHREPGFAQTKRRQAAALPKFKITLTSFLLRGQPLPGCPRNRNYPSAIRV